MVNARFRRRPVRTTPARNIGARCCVRTTWTAALPPYANRRPGRSPRPCRADRALASRSAEAEVGRSKRLVRFLDRQQRGFRANQTRAADGDGETRGRDIVGQIEDHHYVVFAKSEI